MSRNFIRVLTPTPTVVTLFHVEAILQSSQVHRPLPCKDMTLFKDNPYLCRPLIDKVNIKIISNQFFKCDKGLANQARVKFQNCLYLHFDTLNIEMQWCQN